ncbi:MAG: glutaminase [Candidatus Nitrohelix vancouverensis]|uniref:Glutaminase n=1 Tax=Candidatus Nitrohelix vancouverensis TaxID=2705534 RepID=A0A7T0G2I6_9BACT|nr:MAG: glutaminase [Candidatus Nitrohelix vancouverensis]
MNYKKLFAEIDLELKDLEDKGKVASYIPELRDVDPAKLGIHLVTVDQKNYSLGDSAEKFSIQSISKALTLTLAFKLDEDKLWKRVGVEPSGTPFNSLIQLEYEKGIPRNPFINAGALVTCDVLLSRLDDPKQEFIEFVRKISGNPKIDYSPHIAESEKRTGFRNNALINLMKEYGNIKNKIDDVLDFYFHHCSIEMSCKELAHAFLFLANYGVHPKTGEEIIDGSKSKRINAIMQLCGFYDEAGEFAFKVGLPGKSGVGGGIIAIHPGKFSIAVWSPKLNKKGNSYKGMRVLESLTSKTQSSIF